MRRTPPGAFHQKAPISHGAVFFHLVLPGMQGLMNHRVDGRSDSGRRSVAGMRPESVVPLLHVGFPFVTKMSQFMLIVVEL